MIASQIPAAPAHAAPEYDGTFLTVQCSSDVDGMRLADLDGDGKLDLIAALENGIAIFHGNGDGTFGAETDYGPAGDPQDVAVGDFNNDGKPDVACVDASGLLTLLLSDGSGGYLPVSSTATGTPLTAIATGDYNGDGHPDLVACGSSNVVVWLWTAPGTFGSPILTPLGTAANDLAVGDIDQDGKLDLVVTSTIFLGHGDGTFGPGSPTPASGSAHVALGNLNADSLPDLVLDNHVYLNSGGGHFSFLVDFASSTKPGVLVGDFTSDGLADVMEQNAQSFRLNPRTGPGAFAPGILNWSGDHLGGRAAAGDINGDGKLDIVLETYPNVVDVHLGNGDGSFGTKRVYGPVSAQPSLRKAARIGDFNRDGHLDAFQYDTVFPGMGNGNLGSPITTAGLAFPDAAVADFDRDGKLDLAGVEPSHDVRIARGNGDGTFSLGPPGTAIGAQAIALGDLNGDGLPDLATADGTLGVSAFLGHGDGTFDRFDHAAPGQKYFDIDIADFNGDGKADLAASNLAGSNISIFFGHGDGTFDDPVSITTHPSPNYLAAGDLNGDGYPDLAVTNDDGFGTLVILINSGHGTFTPEIYPQPEDAYLQEVAIADLNGDGHPDVAAGDGWFNTATVFPGDGTGALGAPVLYGASAEVQGLAVADLNEDGAPDLLTSARFGQLVVHLHAAPQPVPALFSVRRANALPDRVELAWYASTEPGTPVTILRTEGLAGWTTVGSAVVDGSSTVAFVDHDVRAGGHYGYAVSVGGALSGDVFVDVPSAMSLAFLGARPNPARGGVLTLAIRLGSARPALVEVFSVDGRRLMAQHITGAEAGEHLVKLESALPTGVQVVRVTQDGHSVTGRVAVIQ